MLNNSNEFYNIFFNNGQLNWGTISTIGLFLVILVVAILLYVKKIELKHTNIVKFMYTVIIINEAYYFVIFLSIFFILFMDISNFCFITPKFHFILSNLRPILFCLFLLCIIIIMKIFYSSEIKQSPFLVELKDIKYIPSYMKFVEYYSTLLPIFLFSSGLIFINLFYIFLNVYFLFIGITLIGISPSLIILFMLSRRTFSLYYTLNRANNIFTDYIIKEKNNNIYIEEFNDYFRKSMNNIDINLKNGIKIDQLKIDNDISVKKSIVHYLPTYIKFGTHYQIDNLKDQLNKMLYLIDKDSNFKSLEITQIILNIYENIESFLEKHNYSVTKQHWYIDSPLWVRHWGVILGPYIIILIFAIILISMDFLSGSIDVLLDLIDQDSSSLISFITFFSLLIPLIITVIKFILYFINLLKKN